MVMALAGEKAARGMVAGEKAAAGMVAEEMVAWEMVAEDAAEVTLAATTGQLTDGEEAFEHARVRDQFHVHDLEKDALAYGHTRAHAQFHFLSRDHGRLHAQFCFLVHRHARVHAHSLVHDPSVRRQQRPLATDLGWDQCPAKYGAGHRHPSPGAWSAQLRLTSCAARRQGGDGGSLFC